MMPDQLKRDAEYLALLLGDPHGLTRDDLATCFEVANWDITAWKARFRSALRHLISNRLAVKVGDRYFSAPKRECEAQLWRRPHRPSLRHALLLAACRRIGQATARRRRAKQPENRGV